MSRHQQPMLSQWNDSNFPHLKVSSRWMSTTHSETHCDRHHELQLHFEKSRKFCANFAEIVDIFRNLVLLRQRRLQKFCGNFAEMCGKFSARGRSANPTFKICASFAQVCIVVVSRGRVHKIVRKFVCKLEINFGQIYANTPFPMPPSPDLFDSEPERFREPLSRLFFCVSQEEAFLTPVDGQRYPKTSISICGYAGPQARLRQRERERWDLS